METGILAVTVVIASALIALIALARRSRRARDRPRPHEVAVEGEVLDVWQDGMGSFCVRYRFTPRGGAGSITCDEFAGCLRAVLPEVGERVAVRYDPAAPERARLHRESC